MANVVLGIDPGKHCGAAFFKEKKLVVLETYDVFGIMNVIKKLDEKDLVVIEDSRLQSVSFNDRASDNKRVAFVKGRAVGGVDMICSLIESLCLDYQIPMIKLSPKAKGAKLDSESFKKKTGWTDQSNVHERDAAMVAWPYRRGVKES